MLDRVETINLKLENSINTLMKYRHLTQNQLQKLTPGL